MILALLLTEGLLKLPILGDERFVLLILALLLTEGLLKLPILGYELFVLGVRDSIRFSLHQTSSN